MAHFNLENYETVEERLVRFWQAYPDAEIITQMLHYDGKTVVFSAKGVLNGKTLATGHAEEVHGSSPVNKTSFVENCETSAIGRMIANSALGTKPGARPSRQEMSKVNTQQPAIRTMTDNDTSDSVSTIVREFNATVVNTGAPAVKNVNDPASVKQIGMLRAILRGKELSDAEQFTYCSEVIGRQITSYDDLTKGEASQLITWAKG